MNNIYEWNMSLGVSTVNISKRRRRSQPTEQKKKRTNKYSNSIYSCYIGLKFCMMQKQEKLFIVHYLILCFVYLYLIQTEKIKMHIDIS